MKILIRQFLSKLHSWSVIGWGLADALIAQGHEVHLFSTDGLGHLPEHLKPYLIGYVLENQQEIIGRAPDAIYDSQISYTAMKNFPALLGNGNQKRFGIWCIECVGTNVLPTGFAKYHLSCDTLCAPTTLVKQDMFISSGIPEEKIRVIPHGINIHDYQKTSTMVLPTKKKFKILTNLAQLHIRKNIPGLLNAYGKAFTKQDDVCLIIKAKDKPVKSQFEISLKNCLDNFYRQYPQHAEVKVLSSFINDMSDLYRSVDAVFTMSFGEGFYMPALEASAAGKINITPTWDHKIDHITNDTSLMISDKRVRANPKALYWEAMPNAEWFEPSITDAVDKLRFAYHNYEKLNAAVELQRPIIYQKYSWENITKMM